MPPTAPPLPMLGEAASLLRHLAAHAREHAARQLTSGGGKERSAALVIAALVCGTILIGVVCLLALHVRIKQARAQTQFGGAGFDPEPPRGDDILQVIVDAHDQEAELEVEMDAFDSYEELRELVVEAVPQMFNDSDALLMDYANGSGGWTRVKTKTPLQVVKNSRSVRLKCNDKLSRKIARRLKKVSQGNSGFERVRNSEC